MLCKDIIKIIEQDYSPRYALSWDMLDCWQEEMIKKLQIYMWHWMLQMKW